MSPADDRSAVAAHAGMVGRRPLAALLAGVSAMIVVFTLTTTSATAATPQLRRLTHVSTGLCLDASISQGVRLNRCNGTDYQGWVVDSGRWVHLQTGLCLDGSITRGVRLNYCNAGPYQEWYMQGDTFRTLVGSCLDGTVSPGVRMKSCTDERSRKWQIRAWP